MQLRSERLKERGAKPAHVERLRISLADGASTTGYVASYSLEQTAVRVRVLPGPMPLESWCRSTGVREAMVGGFYIRAEGGAHAAGTPLGELQTDGVARDSVPFVDPWAARRACVHAKGARLRIARREDLPSRPDGDLLQSGPLLVRDGQIADWAGEGFSAGAGQFDSDITVGRYPRAALGSDGDRAIAFACDGRADDDAGLTLAELAQTLIDLGSRDALNLDGGGSASLVCGGRLQNVPRESHGVPLDGGRAIATALEFAPR
jgi:Phosphodiester glycosidase